MPARRLSLVLLCVAALGLPIAPAHAAPGDLDPSFGTGGIALAGVPGDVDSYAASAAVQTDGRIVAVGNAGFSGAGVAVRYRSDGTLDPTFGTSGRAYLGPGAPLEVLIDSAGRILVRRFSSITRLLPDGSLDTAFGSGGSRTISLFSWSLSIRTMAVAPGDAILVGGEAHRFGTSDDWLVLRLKNDGSLDPTYGIEGAVIHDWAGQDDVVGDIAVQPDGRAVVFGSVGGAGKPMGLARLLPDGALDPSFGGGFFRFRVQAQRAVGRPAAVGLQPDGGIVVASEEEVAQGVLVPTLARFQPGGVRDSAFGGIGYVPLAAGETNQLTETYLTDMRVSGDGRPVTLVRDVYGAMEVIRTTRKGGPDTKFGVAGRAPLPPSAIAPIGLVVQPDGAVILPGQGPETAFAVARLTPTGAFDSGFGDGGVVVTSVGQANATLSDVIQLPDGRLVALASRSPEEIVLVRFASDGSVDTSFGDAGFAVANVAPPCALGVGVLDCLGTGGNGFFATRLAVQTDGKLLVAGTLSLFQECDFIECNSEERMAVARFTADGFVDSAFGTDGLASATGTGSDEGLSVALQPDGRIVVAGSATRNVGVTRFLASGASDLSFGSGGAVVTSVTSGSDVAYDVVAGSGGEITVGASVGVATDDLAVLRYLPNGALDTSFGGDGVAVADTNASAEGEGAALTVTAAGDAIVAGAAAGVNVTDAAVARFRPDGTPDPGFGTGGLVVLAAARKEVVRGVEVDSAGRLVLGGISANFLPGSQGDITVVRLLSDGTLDAGFGSGGTVVTDLAGGWETPAALLVTPGDRILVGTTAARRPETNASLLGLVRYLAA